MGMGGGRGMEAASMGSGIGASREGLKPEEVPRFNPAGSATAAPVEIPLPPSVPVPESTQRVTAVVDTDRCAGCGICVDACLQQAIWMNHGIAAIDRQRCTGCGTCIAECPQEALALRP
jgi:NAD-dependent dihydropyrimidine dehydrogenase PreA subunit